MTRDERRDEEGRVGELERLMTEIQQDTVRINQNLQRKY